MPPVHSTHSQYLSPFNSPLMASTGLPPSVSSESGSGRPLDMIPLPGEAADGEEVFPFPFGPEKGFSLGPGFGMEEGSKKHNPVRDSIRRDWNRWGSNAREKERRGINLMVNTKSAKGKQSHHPPSSQKSPPTSNMHCGINVPS